MKFAPTQLSEALKNPMLRLRGLAQVSGISLTYLYALRDCSKTPSAEILGRLATALHKPIDYFFADDSFYSEKEAI